ncbi:hypothetical protein CERZMDRAFT_81682 [Cercospora zeae-maydis SCOH1-5]|uniref:Uncharacterized protein n=1 Tax=Cercospora zeae-maydis SCOH1-5 TaxID=717836 RepID=A0A6A6FTU3_9PEZI|nr:hypothetical protein CERZMDRAFT_81682 [Cercospora zeae-maydis SCOH1-5]
MAGFDELIERLLYDVALSGSQGYDAVRFEKAVRAYYTENKETREAEHGGVEQHSLFAAAPPVSQIAVDEKLLSAVLEWLCRHPDAELRRVNPADDLDIAGRKSLNETATPAVTQKLADKRIFTTEDRIWQAIAGHGPDFRRIPPLEFDILSIIAAHSSTGVLQPTITKMTGQDKRSVPKRTDNLQTKGYITKETVIGSTGKTSLLKLIRFSKSQSLEKPYEESAINNLKPVIHYDRMYTTMMRMLVENNGIVTMADLRYGLGIQVAQRWETKILARCVRRLAEGGCIRRVTAKMADREGEVITRIGQPVWKRAKAIQLMRQPTEYDRLLWEQSDRNRKMRASDDEDDDQIDAEGAANAVDSSDENENEDGLVEIGTMKEVGTTAQQIQAFKRQAAAEESGDGDVNDLDRLEDRVPPHWNPDIPLVNILFNQIDEFGEGGISSTHLQSLVVGPLWKRPMDESLAHLTDIWQHSQPPHLRHLTVVRDTAVFGRSAQFKYRTLANFQKAVAAGKAVWDAVLDNTNPKAKKNPLEEKPDLDRWGFPKVANKLLAGRDGRATLAEGRRGVLVDRMLAIEVDEDEVVVEDDEDATPVAPKQAAARAKTPLGRSTKKTEAWESTASIPRPRKKGPVSRNGISVNGKRLGRPRKSDRIDAVTTMPSDGTTRTPQGPYRMRKRSGRTIVPDAELREISAESEDSPDDQDDVMSTTMPQEIPSNSHVDSRRTPLRALETRFAIGESSKTQDSNFSTQEALDSQLAVSQDGEAVPSPEAKSRRGPKTMGRYIPYHKPREIKQKEYDEYDSFAQRTAENRIRLELSTNRKRTVDDAGLVNQSVASKRQRGGNGTIRVDPANFGDASQETLWIPAGELPIDRVAEVKFEILQRTKPGLYINPPGAKNVKAESFVSRGRPRNAKIAVIRSSRLHELDWFHANNSPRFAPAKPLGRTRTATVGSALKISNDIIENSDSDSGQPTAKRQKTAGTASLEDADSVEPLHRDTILGIGPAHESRDSTCRSPTSHTNSMAQDTAMPHIELNGAGRSDDVRVPMEVRARASNLEKDVQPIQRDLEMQTQDVQESNALDRFDASLLTTPSDNQEAGQKLHLQAATPNATAETTSTPELSQDTVGKPPSKTKISDTTSFYLSRFAPEHRATPQQQYRLISAKPGRKSKRDLEVLAQLENLIGPNAKLSSATHKTKPTEIPDHAVFATATPPEFRHVAPSPSSTTGMGAVKTASQDANGAPHTNGYVATVIHPVSTPQEEPATPQQDPTIAAKYSTGLPASAAQAAGAKATEASDLSLPDQATDTESSDGSETDNEDWTIPYLAAASRAASKADNEAPHSDQEAVQPQSRYGPKQAAAPTASNQYFSTAYVNAHPDETFYHVGAGRWKHGMPPPDSYHKTFRGPGAREALLQGKTTTAATANQAESHRDAVRQSRHVQTSASHMPLPSENNILTPAPGVQTQLTAASVASTWQASPLMIVRPYDSPRASANEVVPAPDGLQAHCPDPTKDAVARDRLELSEDNPDEYENLGDDDPGDRTFGEDPVAEDEMDADVSEQVGGDIAEVEPMRALKTTTKKKYGPPRLGGSTQLQRHELILSAVRQCGGVFPGDSEVWYVLTTAWRKIHNRLPDKHTVERAVEQLMTERKLKRFRFQFKSKHSAVITKQILAEPSVHAEDEIVTEMRKKMMKCYPLQYLPEEVEIDEELRETASYKFGRKKAKNGDVKLSQNAATYMKRRHEEFPEDPDLVVHQTADAAARADREAQSRGFTNAQALRKHLQEVHNEQKNRANLKHQEKRRKEQRVAALEDAQIAADIAAEESELLGEAAGQIQLDNYQHDLSAAMQPRPPGYKANISQEMRFDNVLPRGKSTRPVRKTRKPLGSIRAPAPKQLRRVWWEDDRRTRELAAAHLMSPAQVFTPSNGTFGTSGRGLTQQAVNWRAAPGTLSSEQYQKETARVIAQIKQGDQQSSDGAGLTSTAVVTFKISKEKLDAIVLSEPRPAVPPSLFDDDDGSVFEGAPTPSSVAITPEPEPEPEPPKKRRKYKSRKKRQADGDEAAPDSDEDFVPGAVADNLEDRQPIKLPRVKGPGARGVKKAFTTRDRQAHQEFKDVDRLVIAIALISAIAGGVNQGKLSWNLIAHALSYRYEGEFLRRRWGHYARSRKPDVEQLRDDIRQPFLEAYERGELPVVNFQASHETDWPALLDWVQATIPMSMSLTVDEHPGVPDLPASRALVEESFTVEERGQLFELNKDDYFTTITDQNRRHLAQRYVLGNLLPGEIKPSENTNKDLLLAKSWVRAVAMTKQHSYNAEEAARKISVLGNKILKQVADEMVESKMFLQDKKGRHQPGRNFQIHHEVLIQFRRWPATKDCDEHRYLCALAHSWSRINDYFKQADALPLIPVTSDQDYIILTNLCATGMVRCSVVLPETKQEFDAPAPKLSPWGYSGTNYQTKRANQDQLKFDLVYVKLANYKYEPELSNNVPIPLTPPVVEGEIGPRIPFWVDIHAGAQSQALAVGD